MLQVLSYIHQIETELVHKQKSGDIQAYHVALKLDMQVVVHIKTVQYGQIQYTFTQHPKVKVIELTQAEVDAYPHYDVLFAPQKSRIDLSLRRKLSSLLDTPASSPVNYTCPVVAFYGYKGGAGCSTSLALFAAHYAQKGKKVIILDCDFDAPSQLNFFNLTTETPSSQNGIVEYLLDSLFASEPLILQDYLLPIPKDYSGNGQLWLLSAGNTSPETASGTQTHFQHYLQALSRLDFANNKGFSRQLDELVGQLCDKMQPDLILIDTPSGFNDVYGTTSFAIADVVVGMFGNSTHHRVGLRYFLQNINTSGKNLQSILVNAIISDGRFFEHFRQTVSQLNEGQANNPATLAIYREPALEQIGTPFEYKDNFTRLVNYPSSTYALLFEELCQKIDQKPLNKKTNVINLAAKEVADTSPDNATTTNIAPQNLEQPKAKDSNNTKTTEPMTGDADLSEKSVKVVGKIDLESIVNPGEKLIKMRYDLIKKFCDNKLFAFSEKDPTIDAHYAKKKFYLRRIYFELLSPDRFLWVGGKGVGKSYLSKMITVPHIIEKIKQKTGHEQALIHTINIINKDPEKQFRVSEHLSVNTMNDSDYYFYRFWLVYLWNEVAKWAEKEQLPIPFPVGIKPVDIKNDPAVLDFFDDIVYNNYLFTSVERHLRHIDQYLMRNENQKLLVLFDDLDQIIKPNCWNKGIIPLVGYFRNRPFARILPRFFIRRDLYEKMSAMPNFQQMDEHNAMSLEWEVGEVLAYFFKTVLADSHDALFALLTALKEHDTELIDNLKTLSQNDYQIPVQRDLLQPLVDVFFGKWTNHEMKTRLSDNYEWFAKHLGNADNSISLQPFVELLNDAMQQCAEHIAQKDKNEVKRSRPILPYSYYALPENIHQYTQRHFDNLLNTDGNKDLALIMEYIKQHAVPDMRRETLSYNEFGELIKNILDKYKGELENRNVNDLKDLLLLNGLVGIYTNVKGYHYYSFAPLYKNFLGLKGALYEIWSK